jgi:HSP20 family protein
MSNTHTTNTGNIDNAATENVAPEHAGPGTAAAAAGGRSAIQKTAAPPGEPRWAEPSAYYTPRVDVAENGDAYLFQADLPGTQAEDVDVSYQDGVLTLQARVRQRWPDGARPLWSEYGLGHYYRSFELGPKVDPDGIKAELRDGVLSLYVPKAESAKARKIKVQGA